MAKLGLSTSSFFFRPMHMKGVACDRRAARHDLPRYGPYYVVYVLAKASVGSGTLMYWCCVRSVRVRGLLAGAVGATTVGRDWSVSAVVNGLSNHRDHLRSSRSSSSRSLFGVFIT